MRITPENITELKENEVFVFGSNLSGFHGGGAAKTALKWGAQMNEGLGMKGQTYALPTKDRLINTLPVEKIQVYVEAFIVFAKEFPSLNFLVTEIGCGLAGYSPEDIAPLFKEAVTITNIYLPQRFLNQIKTN
jgi:hypothetical protein